MEPPLPRYSRWEFWESHMYEPKTPPFAHQLQALGASRGQSGFAYLMEMGTGKTKVMIDEAGDLFDRHEIDCMVIFCPKGVMRSWERELETHLGADYFPVMWTGSPNKRQRTEMERLATGRFEGMGVLIANIESMRSGRKALDFVKRVMTACRTYLCVDESQTIKGAASRQTKNMLSLAGLARYRRIATGSPSPNSPMDLYTQMEFVSPGSTGQRSYYGFRSRYAVLQKKNFGGRSVQVEVGYRNLDELRQRLDRISFRVRKDECLDLPSKVYSERAVELTRDQERIYSQMREEALAEVGGGFSSSQSAITTLIRLQQIVCGYLRDDEGAVRTIDSRRVQQIVDLAESTDEDMVIWVGQHTPMIPEIQAQLEERFGTGSVARFWGGNAHSRDGEAESFVSRPEVRFMISTQAAGARGNTWVNATHHIYFANTYNLEERVQSEDRSHRSGQTGHVTYTDLVAEGTVDQRLRKALVRKENISATLMGESAREWM